MPLPPTPHKWFRLHGRIGVREAGPVCLDRGPKRTLRKRTLSKQSLLRQSIAGHPGAKPRTVAAHLAQLACSGLAEGEREGLGASVGEGDLEGAFGNRAGLPDELVEPRFGDRAIALAVPRRFRARWRAAARRAARGMARRPVTRSVP
jgi:hypothetical protein